ncbi:MAG: S8 family serine peptidase [Elusimicrobia bacterium]|nr:S8 family serine peptidase [Elusimicrobiota bacterium]
MFNVRIIGAIWSLSMGLLVQANASQKIVTFYPETPHQDRISRVQSLEGKVIRELRIIDALAVEFPDEIKDAKIYSLKGVTNVEEDKYLKWIESADSFEAIPLPSLESTIETIKSGEVPLETPQSLWESDEKLTPEEEKELPWGIKRVNAAGAWSVIDGKGVKVGVVDTGVDYTHPDIAPNYAGGYNAIKPDQPPLDDHGHGTHVSGTIGAIKDLKGVAGVAPKVFIYGVKVLDKNGSGSYSSVIAGIEWCVNNGINVINMSLGGSQTTASMEKAVKAAYDKGVVVVCAAGNDSGPVGYPAKYAESIAVSASNSSDKIASFSSRGPEIDFIAPGVSVYSTFKGGGYKTLSGTSMACPHMAGLAALVVQLGITKPEEVKQTLAKAAVSLNLKPEEQGAGLVDAGKLITTLMQLASLK